MDREKLAGLDYKRMCFQAGVYLMIGIFIRLFRLSMVKRYIFARD